MPATSEPTIEEDALHRHRQWSELVKTIPLSKEQYLASLRALREARRIARAQITAGKVLTDDRQKAVVAFKVHDPVGPWPAPWFLAPSDSYSSYKDHLDR